MEKRIKLQAHPSKSFKAFIGKSEKKCNKCGFVTFSLHVLYNHKYKCRGQLLGHPQFCSHCRRKYNFIISYNSHKRTCVKKIFKQKFFRTKYEQKCRRQREEKQKEVSSYCFSCPLCHSSFESKFKFVDHLKKQNCTQPATKKRSYSARKTLNNRKGKISDIYENKNISASDHAEYLPVISRDKEEFQCIWCKSIYPSEKLLFVHLEKNDACAVAYYERSFSCNVNFSSNRKPSLKARKTLTVVARKSFPQKSYKMNFAFNSNFDSGSAKKSFPSSRKKLKPHLKTPSAASSSQSSFNQCPVCYKEFNEIFTFFQHQKKMNHWGRATKSISSSCKCPFCGKEFLHIKSRNAHVRNHSDKDENEIKAFLRRTTCNICSQIFGSELVKQQHMKMQHSTFLSAISFKKNSRSETNTPTSSDYISKHKMSSVPSSVKKKLKQQPNVCPVCSKSFSHTVLRNKHFNEVHLKIFECQFCNTKFKSISSLTNHIQLSHGENFECNKCRIKFNNELHLLQHVLKIHPNQDPKLFLPPKSMRDDIVKEKTQIPSNEIVIKKNENVNFNTEMSQKNMEYYCDVCDISYQKLCGLQRHRQSKLHKDTLEKNLDAFQKSLSDLPPSPPPHPRIIKHPEILTCSDCSEEFTNIKDFVPHRLSHFSVQSKYLKITEQNPYMCEVCSDVLDSHSKVQLHLFWHLQIESTSNNTLGPSKNDTIVPDRLSGQHVAKKSFTKQTSEFLQEVMIGGVKKPVFTCEACNIGFTTKTHYNMHIRKLCRKINPTNTFKGINSEYIHSKKFVASKKSDIVYCDCCNFLFSSPSKHDQHKEFCTKCYFDSNSEESLCYSDVIRYILTLGTAIAGCITCGAIFDNVFSIAGHYIIHQTENEVSVNEDIEDVLHCALCNSLFSLYAFKPHKDFCKIPINIGNKATNSKHIDVLKSALELKCAIAGCVSCGIPFDDLESFSKHLTLHQTNQIQVESLDMNLHNGEESGTNNENEKASADNPSECSVPSDYTENSAESDNQEVSDSGKSSYSAGAYNSDSFTKTKNSLPSDTSDNFEVLRKNFSELLCLLISDPELMLKLGYGKCLIDDVLINVLEQMGQEPCRDEEYSDLDQFRKNIQILLKLCLKDQILQSIGNEKSVDEIVIEALKILNADENIESTNDLSDA